MTTNSKTHKELGKFISVFVWKKKMQHLKASHWYGIRFSHYLLADAHFPFTYFLKVDSNVMAVKSECFCRFERTCTSDQMQTSNRSMSVIIMSCTWDLLLGTSVIRVVEQIIILCSARVSVLGFLRILKLNGSNSDVRFQIRWLMHCQSCSSSNGGGRSQNRRARSMCLVGVVQDRKVCRAGMTLEQFIAWD